MSIHATNSDMVPRGDDSNVPDDDDEVAVAGMVDDIDSVVVILLWLDFILRSIPPPPPSGGGGGDDEISVKDGLAKYIVVHENAKATNSMAVNSLSVREDDDDPNFFLVVPIMTRFHSTRKLSREGTSQQ